MGVSEEEQYTRLKAYIPILVDWLGGCCGRTPQWYRSSSMERPNRTLQHLLRRLIMGGCSCAQVVSRGLLPCKISVKGASDKRLVDQDDCPLCRESLAYRFYLVVIPTPFGYLKDFNGNGIHLVNSPPRFRNNTGLLRCRLVSRNTREDVRCRHDPVLTTNPAKVGQGPTLRPNIQLFIGIQDLEGRIIKSNPTL